MHHTFKETIRKLEIHKSDAHVSEHVINQGLEYCWGIGQPKWDNKVFVGLLKAFFHSFPSRIWTSWYALRKSSFVNT